MVDARKALDADAPVIRDDMEGKTDNHIFDWEAGDKAETDAVFADADVVVAQDMLYPRVAPGADGDVRRGGRLWTAVSGKLTLWTHDAGAARAPHAVRDRRRAAGAQDPRDRRRTSAAASATRSPIYPGYVCAVVGSIVHRQAGQVDGGPLGEPHRAPASPATTSCTARSPRRATARSSACACKVIADHGAFNATAQPTKYPAGFFHVFTGSYDLEAAHCKVTGVYTNKAPGGVAYACSFRVTEAVYLVERMVDVLAAELGMDPAELRLKNFIQPEQFPYESKTGWAYDSGDYETAMRKAMEMAGYDELRARAGARSASAAS